jgi:hypothetical protein
MIQSERPIAMHMLILLAALFVATTPGSAPAQVQPFSSGSNGSYGPIVADLTTGSVMLDVPPDGIFHATTITVGPRPRGLSFRRNAANTPVYLLATGDVTISGEISVSANVTAPAMGQRGLAGPGGFDGGTPGGQGLPPGDGLGPGRGRGGDDVASNLPNSAGGASFGTRPFMISDSDGPLYGSPLLLPIVGGSGGGGTTTTGGGGGGGGGGGAIVIASDTRITLEFTGVISSRGGFGGGNQNNGANGGSGGAVRLVAPIIDGDGVIDVGPTFAAGRGRIRIDTTDPDGVAIRTAGTPLTVGALMTVFPQPVPELTVVSVGGQTIPGGGGLVQIMLPSGSAAMQPVTVRASNFRGVVPIEISATPQHGASVIVPAQIDMGTGTTAEVTVDVPVPSNVATFINVWKR